jgi:hypothetical protein
MFPHERSLVKELASKPFALIGVNSDPDLEKLKEMNAKEQISWRSFWDGPGPEGTRGPIAKAWNVQGWPTIYLLDPSGKIRFKNLRGEELEKAIKELVAEAEGSN